MNRATLARYESTDQGTFGAIGFGGEIIYSTELPWRDNLPQKSCIPVGKYRCEIVKSPKFGRVYGVMNVPGRSNVLIHSANFGGNSDTGWTTQLHGCIAPCMRVGVMRNNAGAMQKAGLVSRPALARLMDWADGEPFVLEIT